MTDENIIEDIEEAIPEERKNLSFGGPDEGLVDVLEDADEQAHKRGAHEGDKRADCPLCDTEGDR
jgi:hypothetical protein